MENLLARNRIVSWDESCGCSTTRASIKPLTPETFADMDHTEYAVMEAYRRATEANLVGVVPSSLEMLINSRIKGLKEPLSKKNVGKFSANLPYTLRQRESQFHYDYFRITAGAAHPDAGDTQHSSAWNITVTSNDAGGHFVGATDIHKYFLPGQWLYVSGIDVEGDNARRRTAHKIVSAVAGSNANEAIVTIQANKTEAGWDALTEGQQEAFQPEIGVVEVGANNVADEEVWCNNETSNLSRSVIVDYHQTDRMTFCFNKEYRDILKRIVEEDKVNPYLADFRAIPLNEQNKQAIRHNARKRLTSVFYGDKLNELQSPEYYAGAGILNDNDSLIKDPEDGCVLGYKANALGILTLLEQEEQVVDLLGQKLDLNQVFDLCWQVKKNRQVTDGMVDTIDLWTDKDTASRIASVLIRYLKAKYGVDSITRHWKEGKVMDHQGAIHFEYNTFDVPEIQVKIAVFVHDYFTDRARFFSGDARTRGASIWAIDWTDFARCIVATGSREVEYKGQHWLNSNSLGFQCIIAPNTRWIEMRSETWTVQLGDAKRHFVIENFDNSVDPEIDGLD